MAFMFVDSTDTVMTLNKIVIECIVFEECTFVSGKGFLVSCVGLQHSMKIRCSYFTSVSLVRSQLVSLEFFIDIKSYRSHYGPGVDSASNRNEYQEHFLGVKVAGA